MTDFQSPSILIIEDDIQLSANIALILSLEGFDVRIAHDGWEGLHMLQEQQPDLILCDILLPGGMDGRSFHKRILAHPSWSGILFIFLSALNEQDHIRRGMLAGADDYLPKPFTTDELLKAVNVRLKRKMLLKSTSHSMTNSFLVETLPTEQASLLQSISPREREVLLLVGKGLTTKEIAEKLFISPKTVEAHRSSLMKKLEANNVALLARWAMLLEALSDSFA